jgi:pyrroloquinoline-quinone synthase
VHLVGVGNQPKQRGLAHAIRADEGDPRTIGDFEGHFVEERPATGECVADLDQLDKTHAGSVRAGPSGLVGSVRLDRVDAFSKEQGVVGEDVISQIDAVISGRRLLAHPFYQRWLAGELTMEDLQSYAGQYYKFEAAFPGYLTKVLAKLETAADRKVLLQNLVDEEGGTESHLAMFTRFGNALGLSQDQLESAPARDSTRALLDTFAVATSDGSPAEGLVTLYAYESQAAEVAASKTASLMSRYGLKTGDGTDFWSVHAQADELHSAWERELLERLIQDPEPVVAAAGRASNALWGFLDGCSMVA